MDQTHGKRTSHCNTCGKRLSIKTPFGDIRWQSSNVDDDGFYCMECYQTKHAEQNKKDKEE
jgi:hypothetical protein